MIQNYLENGAFSVLPVPGYDLKTESQCLEDFELRVNVEAGKFTFWAKYARYEHNYSSNVVVIHVLPVSNNDRPLNSSISLRYFRIWSQRLLSTRNGIKKLN